MHDVVVGAMPPEVPCDRQAEADRRKQRPALVAVYAPGVDDADHADARRVRGVLRAPVPHRHVGDLVAGPREMEAEVAHPALGATDRLGIEVVVDETDARPLRSSTCSDTSGSSRHRANRELIRRFSRPGMRSCRSPSCSPANLADSYRIAYGSQRSWRVRHSHSTSPIAYRAPVRRNAARDSRASLTYARSAEAPESKNRRKAAASGVRVRVADRGPRLVHDSRPSRRTRRDHSWSSLITTSPASGSARAWTARWPS